jgi:hypothetical protein
MRSESVEIALDASARGLIKPTTDRSFVERRWLETMAVVREAARKSV